MTLEAPAKINLTLDILGRRTDGYHDMRMVMQAVSLGDTVTVATPGGGTGVQLQVNLSTNNDKVTPAVRLLAVAVRPLTWEKHHGHPLNRRLYLPEYCLNTHDPSFGREMDLPLIMAALMNRWGEDILPEEVAYIMEDMATSSTANEKVS